MNNIKSQQQDLELDFPLTFSKQLQNGILGLTRPHVSEGGLQVCPGVPLIQSWLSHMSYLTFSDEQKLNDTFDFAGML